MEKKDFSGNAVNLDGHGNLVLINSTVQVEVSKLNFNFDEIRTYFLQVSRDWWQNYSRSWVTSRAHFHRFIFSSETDFMTLGESEKIGAILWFVVD